MKIKVCGLMAVDQMFACDDMHVDFIGINFYKASKRYFNNNESILLADVKLSHSKKVGVFVNEALEEVKLLTKKHALDYVQLHGEEDVDYCATLSEHVKLIKVIPSNQIQNFNYQLYKKYCTYFLFDTFTKYYGGSGEQFDWQNIISNEIPLPYFIAGGVSIDDANKIKAVPNLFGVDINSEFESSPGMKDMTMIKEFITKLT